MSEADFIQHQTPNPTSSSSHPQISSHDWQDLARSWLSTLPNPEIAPSSEAIDAWINSNTSSLPRDLQSLPRPDLHSQILAVRGPGASASAATLNETADPSHPYRFQRTDLWMPVYAWLETLDRERLVDSREIAGWLDSNAKVTETLMVKHSRYHLIHYIQRLHLKVLKKKGKVHKGVQLSAARASLKFASGGVATPAVPLRCKLPSNVSRVNQTLPNKKSDALLRYELLTDLQNQLTIIISQSKSAIRTKSSISPASVSKECPDDSNTNMLIDDDKNTSAAINDGASSVDVMETSVDVMETPATVPEIHDLDQQRINNINTDVELPAWACSYTLPGTSTAYASSNVPIEDANVTTESSYPRSFSSRNIFICLEGRETGFGWPLACSRNGYAGRNNEKWIPFFQGWRSLEKNFHGPAVLYKRRCYSSWYPTWCAYTSNFVEISPVNGTQGVQKIIDVRFHPEGLPQLVCSSNKAPNELLLYNLYSGRSIQLSGHNCQIQAVDFAVRGASVVSCGANLLKVWDCITGSCLYTLGSVSNNPSSVGHSKKISAMAVNAFQSCFVATSGSDGDGKLLIWNALRGALATDLNQSLRNNDQFLPCIECMVFCDENTLVCGSDCLNAGPAILQIWDVDYPDSCQSFPANNAFISSLKINPSCNTIITGACDGTIGLFDIRTCKEITHLSVGSKNEVTSVSFSSCGTYFSASSTSNTTMVWDTRLMPMSRRTLSSPKKSNFDRQCNRPLHCLSHGKQMPASEYSGQLQSNFGECDQGVNDARWLHREPVLVTVSGNGSLAMWDVTLGQPCMRQLVSHARSVNTVAVAPNDEYLCSGGDDRKVVLYHNSGRKEGSKWRLSHPVNAETSL